MPLHGIGQTVVQLPCDVTRGRLASGGSTSAMSTSSFDLKVDASPPHQSVTSTMGFLSDSGSTPCKSEGRRSNKPVMEKRRRAKINVCLTELKTLILNATKKDPSRHSKLEKADILEMTVKHLQNVQRAQLALAVARDPRVLAQFKTGFAECAQEATRYMTRIEGSDEGLRSRMSNHMTACVSGLQSLTPLAFTAMAAPSLAAANVNIPAAHLLQQAAVNSGHQFVAPMHEPVSPVPPAGLPCHFPSYSSTPLEASAGIKLPEIRTEKEPAVLPVKIAAPIKNAPSESEATLLRPAGNSAPPVTSAETDRFLTGKHLASVRLAGHMPPGHVVYSLPTQPSATPVKLPAVATLPSRKMDTYEDISSDGSSNDEDSDHEPNPSYRHKKLRKNGTSGDDENDNGTPRGTHRFMGPPTVALASQNDVLASKSSAFTAVTRRPLPTSMLSTSHADLLMGSAPEDLTTRPRQPAFPSGDAMKRKFSSEPSLLSNDANRGVCVPPGKRERKSDGDTPSQRDMWRPW